MTDASCPLSYIYTEKDMEWFYTQPGVEEIKVETEAGDLVLWDSRTVVSCSSRKRWKGLLTFAGTQHWNCAPTADRTRVVVYVCMAPASYASEETLSKKAEIFEKRLASTHW